MKKKTKKRDFSEGSFVKLLNTALLLCLLFNVFVIYRFESSRKTVEKRVEYFTTTNSVVVVTNFIAAASSSSEEISSNINTNLIHSLLDATRQVKTSFKFFTWGKRLFIEYYGDFLTIGSPTTYGRIVEIFPDRVLLDSGIYLVNTYRAPSFPEVDKAATDVKFERVKND